MRKRAQSTSPKWCKRCQDRESAPDPRAPLLNPIHEKFCRNVALLTMPDIDAYLAAGCESKNRRSASGYASTIRKRIKVQNRIIALTELAIEQDLATREWIDTQLKEVALRCMQKVPVIVDGVGTGEWKFDARGANAALHLMGKDRGMFVEKFEIRGIDKELHGKSDTEVREMVAANFSDLGRPVCIQLMEKVFGLKYESGGTEPDGGKTPTVESVPTLQ